MPGTWSFYWFPPGVDPDNPGTGGFPLTAPPYRNVRLGSLLGATGPNWTPVTQDVPFQPGSNLKFIKVPDAEIDLRVIFSDIQESYLWQHLAAAFPFFTPLKGQGWLQIQNPSGDIRRIQCTCISGLTIDPSSYKFFSVDADLRFFANYPYWVQSGAANNQTFFPFNDGQNTLLPIMPIFINRLGDTVYEFNVVNQGDVNAAFTVKINGPCESPILTNLSVGSTPDEIAQRGVLNMSANGGISLGTGTFLQIDFFNRTIVKGITNPRNQIDKVTSDSTFWPLLPGTNTIRLQILGASNQTKVQYIWKNTYSTMY